MRCLTAVMLMFAVTAPVAGCSSPATEGPAAGVSPASSSVTAPGGQSVNLANIKRIRSLLPAGYEISEVPGPVSVASGWGFGAGWSAAPEVCGRLVDPAPTDASAQGFAASGAGGIVYVMVSGVDPVSPEAIDQCRQWTMKFGHTTGTFEVSDTPEIDAVRDMAGDTVTSDTVTIRGLTRTSVESGTETHTQIAAAYTYVDGHVIVVSLITDPGSGHPALSPDFATELLTKATAVLRG